MSESAARCTYRLVGRSYQKLSPEAAYVTHISAAKQQWKVQDVQVCTCVDVGVDMYEMLMIQNAQMHQMIMQQLMLSTVSRPAPPAAAAATEANNDDTLVSIDIKDLIDVRITAVVQSIDQNTPCPEKGAALFSTITLAFLD